MLNTSLSDVAQHYSTMQICTASLPKAICMLHGKCTQLLARAAESFELRRELLNRAQNIIAQLQAAIVLEDIIGKSLYYLYDYAYLLLERGEKADIEDAAGILSALRDAFIQLLLTR